MLENIKEAVRKERELWDEQRDLPVIRVQESGGWAPRQIIPPVLRFRDGREIPLPPDGGLSALAPAAKIIARLHSTARRRAWNWWAGDEALKCLNNAPYNPLLRAVVSDFFWGALPPTRDEYCVEQFGTECIPWQVKVSTRIADPIGVALRMLHEAFFPPAAERQWQGSLSVAAVDLPEARELVDLLPTRYSARPPVIHRLLNHAIVVAAEIAYFRAWGERDALHGALLVLDSDASIHILSRDHPEEFLEFRSFKPLVVLLRHPFPTDGRID